VTGNDRAAPWLAGIEHCTGFYFGGWTDMTVVGFNADRKKVMAPGAEECARCAFD